MGDQRRGPDRRVAGERQFAARRENAQRRCVDRIARLKDEDCLRQIEFAGDRLHPRVVEPVGVEHDGERVARQRRLGEHVEQAIGAAHGNLLAATTLVVPIGDD